MNVLFGEISPFPHDCIKHLSLNFAVKFPVVLQIEQCSWQDPFSLLIDNNVTALYFEKTTVAFNTV